jgi:hypothetical protein
MTEHIEDANDEFFDCDCETCVRRQREHIRKMNEGVE